jgi:hypothetical protein
MCNAIYIHDVSEEYWNIIEIWYHTSMRENLSTHLRVLLVRVQIK